MQHTLAFAPTEEDLQDFYFDQPVITLCPPPEHTETAGTQVAADEANSQSLQAS
jgi:hypothetical protein